MQSAQGSTQDVEEIETHSAISDECVRNVACQGECQEICKIEACLNIHGSSIMQEDQGRLSTKHNTQEFVVPGDNCT